MRWSSPSLTLTPTSAPLTGEAITAQTVTPCVRFVVTGGAPVPIICGRNTGHHLYIDAGSGNSPTSLTFITTGSFERAFKMKITQIECGAVNRGVEGCLQYHTGVSGQISSFNYIGNKHCKGLECFQFRDCFTNTGFDCILSDLDEYLSEESEGLQLSNQEYSICVRHERGFCGISYTACEVRIDNHQPVFVFKVS